MAFPFRAPAARMAAFTTFLTFSAATHAQLHDEEIAGEIIVTGSLDRTAAQTALPVSVLSGERLRDQASGTLGETLDELVGVNNAAFGNGVGLPVIRGQSGNRVQVLQSGISNIDASAVSPDHANAVEAGLADRIEVVRGPATLLYGNGAIGGVVNVIDGRIPVDAPDGVTGLLETRHASVADQQTTVLRLDGGSARFAWHIDGLYRDGNETRVPGFATDPGTVDLDDPLAFEELLATKGQVPNSAARSHAGTLGASWLFDGGHLGMAINRSENSYGIPAGAHAHHEEEHDENQDEDNDGAEDPHIEDLHDGVRIAMEQTRVDVDALLPLSGFFQYAELRLGRVDYRHRELEDGVVGTVYENAGYEGRAVFNQTPGLVQGVIGIQFGSRDFSAAGDEAYIAETANKSLALFTVQSLDQGRMTYELGLRAERQAFDQAGSCDRRKASLSSSASAIWNYSAESNVMLALAHSQRAPTIEELYSNVGGDCSAMEDELLVAHYATNRFEIGDPDADLESSNNLELGWRRHQGPITGEFNVFYNRINDYLYLQDTGLFVEDTEVARLQQQDAVFRGAEIEFTFPVSRDGAQRTEVSVFADYVRAHFTAGGDVPRIPPLRAGLEVRHAHADWAYRLRVTDVAAQHQAARGEKATSGYTLINFTVDYHTRLAGQELLLFARAENLLDEEIRLHASHLKHVAPQPGRSMTLGLRLEW